MRKKVFLSPLFQFPIPWMDQYIDNFNKLGEDWHHFIFTDLDLKSRGNVTVVPMNNDQFASLVEQKTGVRPYVPAPSPKFGDTRPAFGKIFEDYIHDFDYWGHTDFDVVFGRVDRFITDELLEHCDIFSNDPDAINGIFSLYRNNEKVNNLFRDVPGWAEIFKDERYHAFDEQEYSELIRTLSAEGEILFIDKFWQEHDNQPLHKPEPILVMDLDGTLRNRNTGKEMMMFHFRRTKRWPL